MDQTLREFLSQSWKSLMRLDTAVASLEAGSITVAALERVLGVVRAIREHSGPLHLVKLQALGRAAEGALVHLRKQGNVTTAPIGTILEAVEAIKESIVGLEATSQEPTINFSDLVARLESISRIARHEEFPKVEKSSEQALRIHAPAEIHSPSREVASLEAETPELLNRSYLVNPRVPDNLMQLVDALKAAQNVIGRPSGKQTASGASHLEEIQRITDELRETVATIWLQPTIGDAVQRTAADNSTSKESAGENVSGSELTPAEHTKPLAVIKPNALVGRSVLVIDNSLFFRQLAIAALEAAGCRTTAVKDVTLAAEVLVRGEQFDAILADVDIPELHEREFSKFARRGNQQIPLIGLTSKSATFLVSRVRQAGFDRCVPKFHTRHLVAAVAELCAPTGEKRIA